MQCEDEKLGELHINVTDTGPNYPLIYQKPLKWRETENEMHEHLLPFNDIERIAELILESTDTSLQHRNGSDQLQPLHRSKEETCNCYQTEPQRTKNNLRPLRFRPTIKKLLASQSKLHQSKIRFNVSTEAAQSNWDLLRENNFDLRSICNDSNKGRSATTYRSEFKHPDDLHELLRNHPRWTKFRRMLTQGVHFKLEEMSKDLHIKDLNEAYR